MIHAGRSPAIEAQAEVTGRQISASADVARLRRTHRRHRRRRGSHEAGSHAFGMRAMWCRACAPERIFAAAAERTRRRRAVCAAA